MGVDQRVNWHRVAQFVDRGSNLGRIYQCTAAKKLSALHFIPGLLCPGYCSAHAQRCETTNTFPGFIGNDARAGHVARTPVGHQGRQFAIIMGYQCVLKQVEFHSNLASLYRRAGFQQVTDINAGNRQGGTDVVADRKCFPKVLRPLLQPPDLRITIEFDGAGLGDNGDMASVVAQILRGDRCPCDHSLLADARINRINDFGRSPSAIGRQPGWPDIFR